MWPHSFFVCTKIVIFIDIFRKYSVPQNKEFTIYCVKLFTYHSLSYFMQFQKGAGLTLVWDYSLVFYLPGFLFIYQLFDCTKANE